MLSLNQLQFKPNMLVIEEEEVIVESHIGTVQKSPEKLSLEKKQRIMRIGRIVQTGVIEEDHLTHSVFRGKTAEQLVGEHVLYRADIIEQFDQPTTELLEAKKQNRTIVLLNIAYVYAAIKTDN